MSECYVCAKLAELRAENNALRSKVDELTARIERLPRTVDECDACQEAHEHSLMNAKRKMDELERENARQ